MPFLFFLALKSTPTNSDAIFCGDIGVKKVVRAKAGFVKGIRIWSFQILTGWCRNRDL